MTDFEDRPHVCFPLQGASTTNGVLGSGMAGSDKALCLINTVTVVLSGQSRSSSLLKCLRKSLSPFGGWYSNFPPASPMIRPEMRQTKCDCLSRSLSFLPSPLFSLHFPTSLPLPLLQAHPRLSFLISHLHHLCARRKYNIICFLLGSLMGL